jgi:outer membrane protein assembly factor BamB
MTRLLPLLLLPSFAGAEPAALPDLPAGITSFGAALHDGALHVFGGHLGKPHGYSRDEVLQPVLRLPIAPGSTWEELPPDEPALGAALVSHPAGLLRLGGMQPRNPKGEEDDLWSLPLVRRFAPASRTWNALPDLPAPRSSHDACRLGDTVFVVGGWNLRGPDEPPVWADTALRLDLSAPEPRWESFPQPFRRRALAVAATPTRLHALGGLTAEGETSLRVDVLDLASGTWSVGPDLPDSPVKGFGLAATAVGDAVFVTGFSGGVHRLDPGADAWTEVARLAHPRMFARLVADEASSRLLVIGGSGKGGHVRAIESVPLTPPPAAGPTEAWRRPLGAGLSGFTFADASGLVCTAANRDDTDHLLGLDPRTGEERWSHAYAAPRAAHAHPIVPGGPASSPVATAGTVFFLGRHGHFHALDAATGAVRWKTDLVADLGARRPEYGYASVPCVHEGLVFVDAGGTGVSTVAFDAATGAVRWKAGDRAAGYAGLEVRPLGGVPTLVVFKADALVGLDPADGTERWSIPWETREGINAATPAWTADGSGVFLASTTGGLARVPLPPASGPAWRLPDTGLLFNAPVLWNGALYGFNDNRRDTGEFFCRDAGTGEVRWLSNECGKGSFQFLPDGRLVTLSSQGELTLARLSASGLEPLHRVQALPGRCYPPVAVRDGIALCRNNDGETVAYRLP